MARGDASPLPINYETSKKRKAAPESDVPDLDEEVKRLEKELEKAKKKKRKLERKREKEARKEKEEAETSQREMEGNEREQTATTHLKDQVGKRKADLKFWIDEQNGLLKNPDVFQLTGSDMCHQCQLLCEIGCCLFLPSDAAARTQTCTNCSRLSIHCLGATFPKPEPEPRVELAESMNTVVNLDPAAPSPRLDVATEAIGRAVEQMFDHYTEAFGRRFEQILDRHVNNFQRAFEQILNHHVEITKRNAEFHLREYAELLKQNAQDQTQSTERPIDGITMQIQRLADGFQTFASQVSEERKSAKPQEVPQVPNSPQYVPRRPTYSPSSPAYPSRSPAYPSRSPAYPYSRSPAWSP